MPNHIFINKSTLKKQEMSIYHLPHEIIALIAQKVPSELHFVLKCIKFFVTYVQKPQIIPLMKYSVQHGYVNILREFLRNDSYRRKESHKWHELCLWNRAIKNNQIECLKLLIELGEKPTLYWKSAAARYSAQIFIWLFDEYKSIGINRYDCQFRAIDAGNIDVLSHITLKTDRFNKLLTRAIESGQLASVKFIVHLSSRNFRKNVQYTTLAIYHTQADILNYLLHEKFAISAQYVQDHLPELPFEILPQHDEYCIKLKSILESLARTDAGFASIANQL